MRIDAIESFLAVSDELSFTRAAARLFRDQAAVSRHVRHMEEELGVRLLDRNTHSVSLTDDGLALLPHLRATVSSYRDGLRLLEQRKRESEFRLSIAYNYLANDSLTTEWLLEFRDENGVTLHISEADPDVIIQRVTGGIVDGAFVGYIDDGTIPRHLGELLIHAVGEHIIVGSRSPLAEKTSLRIDDLLDLEFVYPYKTPPANLSLIQHDLARIGRTVSVSHTDFFDSALKAVEMGTSVTDRPASVQMDGKNLVRIPYECPDKIKYSFIWDPARRNPLIEKLVSLLKAKIPTQNLLEE